MSDKRLILRWANGKIPNNYLVRRALARFYAGLGLTKEDRVAYGIEEKRPVRKM